MRLRLAHLWAEPGNQHLELLWRASGNPGCIFPNATGPLAEDARVVPRNFPGVLRVLADSLSTSWHELVEPDTLQLGRYTVSASLYVVDREPSGYVISVAGSHGLSTTILVTPGRGLMVREPSPFGLPQEGVYVVPVGPLGPEDPG